jgi:hypothetical protein
MDLDSVVDLVMVAELDIDFLYTVVLEEDWEEE